MSLDALKRLRTRMAEKEVGALLISDSDNVGWLTGFTGSFALVLVTSSEALFLTDARYTIQAAEQVKNMPTESFGPPMDGVTFLAEHVTRLGIEKLYFEGDTTTYATWKRWQDKLAPAELSPAPDIFTPLRLVKTPDEVVAIRKACGIADAAFDHIRRMIQPGVAEYDLMLDLEFFIRRQGAEIAFPSIVVSGERSARPHGVPSEKTFASGDFLTLDFGAKIDGYCSDITRTVVIGEASDRHRQVYGAVLEAQLAALDAMRPGAIAKDVDKLARDVLAKHDLAQYFTHSLGHGLGRVVHDCGRLGSTSDTVFEPGQVWTVEPGVYISGFGGVRIEDDVVVTDTGIDILTSSDKTLLVLPRKE